MTTEAAYTDLSTPLGSLQEELSSLIETFIHLGVQVHDFKATEEAKLGLSNNINKVVAQLKDLSNRKDLSNVSIPLEIINYIEDGRNPDIYTREFVEVVRKINQHLNGKSLAFEKFQNMLGHSIVKEFPDLEKQVEEITKRTKV
ncbi:unnamed protein product [Ambrosiozyma monospora]|uniref:Mediator of RNA polymerase II transcription subunit 10 n=1 Tax=Ambrosiozyma monospora TaxID=43982 RepID=A0A9W6YX42_AMBMO|nr:unnamed protein product [Ambrosiozyma monospora]